MKSGFAFQLDAINGAARAGVLTTPHGAVPTPLFMPVGTMATVKGVDVDRIRKTGAKMVLGNAYHLHLRPGEAIVAEGKGLAEFMGWSGPTLTDSGGFQVFSLAQQVHVTDDGAFFRSHIDGAAVALTPEASMDIQQKLGADIVMQLDHVVALPNDYHLVADAMRRSLRWAQRCRDVHMRSDQILFAIVQGGLDLELRQESAEQLREIGFDGYAVGGLSVGEGAEAMDTTLRGTLPSLPIDCPRYLMGVGQPRDIIEAVAAGIDMFDCVLPTRCGRTGLAYTFEGLVRIKNAKYAREKKPLEEGCSCVACRHSVSYLRHLFLANEMLGPILTSIHNLTFYQRLVGRLRSAILGGTFQDVRLDLLSRYEDNPSRGSKGS